MLDCLTIDTILLAKIERLIVCTWICGGLFVVNCQKIMIIPTHFPISFGGAAQHGPTSDVLAPVIIDIPEENVLRLILSSFSVVKDKANLGNKWFNLQARETVSKWELLSTKLSLIIKLNTTVHIPAQLDKPLGNVWLLLLSKRILLKPIRNSQIGPIVANWVSPQSVPYWTLEPTATWVQLLWRHNWPLFHIEPKSRAHQSLTRRVANVV